MIRIGTAAPSALAAAVLMSWLSTARAADLVIAVPNWPSGQVTANILGKGIEEAFGLQVELRELGTLTAFAGLDSGDIDIHPEVWRPNLDDLVRKYELEKGSVMITLTGIPAWQGLCATPEAVARGIVDIDALSDPAKTAALDTDGDGRGELWVGAQTWSSTGIEKVRANSYGYGRTLTLVEAEEDVAMAAVDTAVATGQPMVFACRTPHHVFKLHDIVRLEEPKHQRDKWNIAPFDDPLWIQKSRAPVAWPDSHFHIAFASALAQEHPEVVAFLRRVDLRQAEISDMSYALQVERQEPDAYASQWIIDNGERLARWAQP